MFHDHNLCDSWKVVCFRVLVNLIILGLLSFSAFAVIMVVKRSTEKEANSTVWRKNEITVVMSLITLFFPMVFEVIGFLEQYHPRKQLRLQLARIMVLNLLNLYSLIFALFDKISIMTSDLHNFKNISCGESTELDTTVLYPTPVNSSIYIVNATRKISPPSSYSLINEENYNISNVTQFLNFIKSTIDLATPNTTSFDDLTTENDNYTSVMEFTDFPFFNSSLQNMSILNDTIGNFTEYNITEIKDLIVDYLSYILFTFGNNTEDTEESDTNITVRNYTGMTESGYEIIKSTLLPLLNNISTYYDEWEVNRNLTTLYNEISTAVTSFEDSFTTAQNSICQNCAVSYESTSISLPTVEVIIANYSMCARLRSLCWETMFGQELIKLTLMDLIMTVLSTLAIDFFRGIFVRVMNRCWCWDLEKRFPQYGDFKVAENILHLVNNQGMVWMGMFFSPGLVVLNVVKLYIMMYFRAWAVLTCNVPHEVIFRASRSNNFYYALLLMMLFLCVLPVGYAIVWIKPSWHCGPFSNYQKIFHIFTETIKNNVPEPIQKALDYIASPGIVIPLLVLLILIIYYLVSLTGALREANDDLKIQLRRERTEERRKMFQIVDRRRGGGSGESNELSNTPFTKWKKLLENLPSGKSFEDTPKQQSEDLPQPNKEKIENKNKDFLSKFIKKALGKTSTSEEEPNAEEGTDTEQHDSLPYDPAVPKPSHKPVKPSLSWNNTEFQNVVSRAVRANSTRLSSLQSDSVDSGETKKDIFELKRKFAERVMPSTSKDMRQDSGSSVWSDNIPVITISKTESDENILKDTNSPKRVVDRYKFKPKIKSVLKKQSTEFDEDTICHFNKDLEKNLKDNAAIKAVAEEDIEYSSLDCDPDEEKCMEKVSDQSSSEDTEFKETSVDTILNFPGNIEKMPSSEEKTTSEDSVGRFS